MTTIPALPFSGQQLRDTLTALDGAIDTKEASGAVAAHVAAADPHAQYTTTVEAAAAAPVQAVALSVPAGWGGTSANVGGNVTLTLALPVGSTLVGSSDRTNWDAAYSERNRWDGGATDLVAATGRTSLGLGNVDNTSDASKPISSATATALAGKAATGAISSSGLTMASARLLGRSTAGTGGPEEIILGANLTLSGGTLSASVTGGGGGTVSSVGLVAPTGFSVSGSPVTTSGNITLAFAAGYSLPTTASQGNWDTAFTERGSWDGGATGLNAATGRASLGLGTLATANAATPPALGGTTPAAGAFTNLSASVELTLPSGAPATPAARDVYAVADTVRYRDSANAERLLLNASDNLANLASTTAARANLGLTAVATATVGSGLSLSGNTLSATGGGGSTPLVYTVGNWIVPFEGAGGAGSALTANQVAMYPFVVRRNVTVNNLGARVTTVAASSNLQLAIYGSDSVNKVTGTPLGATGALSGAAATTVSGSITAFTLQAGLIYWAAVNSDGTPTMLAPAGSSMYFNSILGAASLADVFVSTTAAIQLRTVAQAYGTWPDLTSITPTVTSGASNALKGALIGLQVSALP